MKTKYIKVNTADRLPAIGKTVSLFIDDMPVGLGFLLKTGNFFICMDVSPKVQPTHWLDEIPDREEEMREILQSYISEFEEFNVSAENYKKAKELLNQLKQ